MALNSEFIGRTYPATEPHMVSREKIREFASSLGETSSLYFDVDVARAAGFADVIAPPTFAITISLGASVQVTHDPELGMDNMRVVHGDQKFVHHRVITAGDQLTCVVSVEDIRSAAGNDMVMIRADFADELGGQVCTVYSMLLSRGTDSP